MPSHSAGLGIWLSVWRFLLTQCLYERAAEVLARLRGCAGAWTVAARIGNKYQIRLTRSILNCCTVCVYLLIYLAEWVAIFGGSPHTFIVIVLNSSCIRFLPYKGTRAWSYPRLQRQYKFSVTGIFLLIFNCSSVCKCRFLCPPLRLES